MKVQDEYEDDKFEQYGRRMYLSENQREHLERIAGDE